MPDTASSSCMLSLNSHNHFYEANDGINPQFTDYETEVKEDMYLA